MAYCGHRAKCIELQHLHAPLATGQLDDVPQPVVVLIEVLFEKDPARRFQSPSELLKAMPTVTGAVDAGRRITRQTLQKMPPAASRALTRKRLARLRPERISVARMPVTGSDVFGREEIHSLCTWRTTDGSSTPNRWPAMSLREQRSCFRLKDRVLGCQIRLGASKRLRRFFQQSDRPFRSQLLRMPFFIAFKFNPFGFHLLGRLPFEHVPKIARTVRLNPKIVNL